MVHPISPIKGVTNPIRHSHRSRSVIAWTAMPTQRRKKSINNNAPSIPIMASGTEGTSGLITIAKHADFAIAAVKIDLNRNVMI